MKTVGERIRQAREYRGYTAEELAARVGYKTQSGISNLENRATGRGGFALPKIAEELNIATEWFLQGPDTDNMNEVPTFRAPIPYTTQHPAAHLAREPEPQNELRAHAHRTIDQISDRGLIHAVEMLEGLAQIHSIDKNYRAGLHLPAQKRHVA